jgi:hypothetical protein
MARGPATAIKEETVEGKGGLMMSLWSWQPASKKRSATVICHGLNSHGGEYIGVAGQFAENTHCTAIPSSPAKTTGSLGSRIGLRRGPPGEGMCKCYTARVYPARRCRQATVAVGSQLFQDEVGSKDKSLKLCEGHAHDLPHDVGKEQVMADIMA